MQLVKHPQPNIHEIFDDFDRIYHLTSKRDDIGLVNVTVNSAFKPVFGAFSRWGGVDYKVGYKSSKYGRITRLTGKTIVLSFSGGKDSTATALYLKDQGEDVVLYHLRGVNKTYRDEWQTAQEVAKALDLPLVMEEVLLVGNQQWVEHPLKNMIIANRALQYAIREHKSKRIAFGNFSSSTLDADPFDVCGGDCAEMWRMYERVMNTVIKDFHVITPLTNMKDTLDTLIKHPDLATLPQSCIGPYRYRDYLHDENVKKYNVELPERHCGSCWKCCLEYIVYADNGLYKYNRDFYKHCLNILRNTLYKETGVRYTIDDSWGHYFFYSKAQSKYYQENGL